MSDTEQDPITRERRAYNRTLLQGLLGVALFLSWQAISLHRYIGAETRPPSWDQSVHLETSLDYLHALQHGRWRDALYLRPKPGMPPFPPIYSLELTLFARAENQATAAMWLNWLYLVILSGAVFSIAFHFNRDSTALAAVLLLGCSPVVQNQLHTQLIDLAVAACAALAYLAFFISDDFREWPGSLAFGCAFALGMLHKWSFFSYVFPLYWAAFTALWYRESRFKVLAAALIAIAGTAPWYVARLPDLVPRLIQATADNAVPFWKGGAFFVYFSDMANDLGPLVWLLGWIALLAPHTRRQPERAWVLSAWVLTSYVFWALVPNRQMRFLLPGLPGLIVLLCGPWPKPLVWIAATVQIFTAANFTSAFIRPQSLETPVLSLRFFPTEPPIREDWKIPDILREAQKRAPPDAAFSNLTLVANDTFFNGPTFNYEVKRLGISNINIRGVNKRLCEFSEFVLVKHGSLGPVQVIGGLPEASKLIDDPSGWFQRAYSEAGRWALPDGSTAVLYQQRSPSAPTFPKHDYFFASYAAPSGQFSAKNLRIALGPWDSRRSVYVSAGVSADEVELRGLRVQNLRVELSGVRLVPAGPRPEKYPWEDVRMLGMSRLKIQSLRVSAVALEEFIAQRAPGLTVEQLIIDRGLQVRLNVRGLRLSAILLAETADNPPSLLLRPLRLQVNSLPLPPALLGRFRTVSIPLTPNPETPFRIDLPGLTFPEGVISVP